MGTKVTLGGDRLGAGGKQKIELHGYERSTHDLSYVWRSTNSAGTLVPFLSMVGLPSDDIEIDLNVDVMTHPTIGPLFGSYKVQLDVFSIPMRLYNGKLHMNQLELGMDMKRVKFPQVDLQGRPLDRNKDLDNQHINPSCIFSYLGIRGLGDNINGQYEISRKFNAIPWLAYWDIYKNYYANKQEEIGAVIHNNMVEVNAVIDSFSMCGQTGCIVLNTTPGSGGQVMTRYNANMIVIFEAPTYERFAVERLRVEALKEGGTFQWYDIDELFDTITWDDSQARLNGTGWLQEQGSWVFRRYEFKKESGATVEPKVVTFPLANIDWMRSHILTQVNSEEAIVINRTMAEPYILPLLRRGDPLEETATYSLTAVQEGLALKTYQSDLFNNWISTEWIDGDNGINEITAIKVVDDKIYIDEINLANKIYNMLNRIALSGGTYDDWLQVNWSQERGKSIENPVYLGGLIKELVFQEVVSNAATAEQPLGTLAGRGKLNGKHKGGKIKVRVDEPSYIMGIYSLTPRVDYSQGNEWDTNLKNMDELHKPALDEIGFQDLITDQMAWWDTLISGSNVNFRSAGKQPAWINYMTNTNKVKGNFAVKNDQMWMTLNRRYEPRFLVEENDRLEIEIKDLTTYIDPVKFNHIFANTRRDAQNFWTQIACDIKARRKMSAKVIPNL